MFNNMFNGFSNITDTKNKLNNEKSNCNIKILCVCFVNDFRDRILVSKGNKDKHWSVPTINTNNYASDIKCSVYALSLTEKLLNPPNHIKIKGVKELKDEFVRKKENGTNYSTIYNIKVFKVLYKGSIFVGLNNEMFGDIKWVDIKDIVINHTDYCWITRKIINEFNQSKIMY